MLKLAADGSAPGLYLLSGNPVSPAVLDGTGEQARFGDIGALALDPQGNAYVYDAGVGDDRIGAVRKVAPNGQVSTLDLPDAVGDAADHVRSLDTDSAGNLYLLSNGNNAQNYRVRKRNADGGLSTLVSVNSATALKPALIAVSGAGQAYLVYQTHVTKLAADGGETVLAGAPNTSGAVDGAGAAARFTLLRSAAVGADGKLVLIDYGNGVRQVTPDGVVTTLAKSAATDNGDGGTATARLHDPVALAVDAGGTVLVTDYGYDNYINFSAIGGGTITTLFRTLSHTNWRGQNIGDAFMRLAPDGSFVVASDTAVARLGKDGVRAAIAGRNDDSVDAIDGQGAAARHLRPYKLAADAAGNVYSLEGVAPGGRIGTPLLVRKTTPAGVVGTLATVDPALGTPTGIAITPDGKVMISVAQNLGELGGTIYQIADNALTLVAGKKYALPIVYGPVQNPVDGSGAAARFRQPILSGVDADGNLYVFDKGVVFADHSWHDVWRKITPQGVVTSLPENTEPTLLPKAADAGGNLYGIGGAGIYRNKPGDVVAGTAGKYYTVLGALPGQLEAPQDIVKTGPYTFVVATGSALVRLVVPH